MSSKEEILSLLSSIKREGIPSLTKFLEESSYFTDPASCFDYNSEDGGLASHSLNVYKNLDKLKKVYPELENLDDSLKIIGLLHDVSIIGTFQKEHKNVPLQGSDGKNKRGENGKLIFVEKESYSIIQNGELPYPQGQLSAMIIKRHIKLTKLEDLAIQWHKGNFDISNNVQYLLKKAQKTHKVILLTYLADLEATLYIG